MHRDLCFTLMQISVLLRSQHGGNQMRISDIAHFTHSKNLDNMIDKLQQLNYLISCENYLSSRKCATTPDLCKVCNANGKVKNSTKL